MPGADHGAIDAVSRYHIEGIGDSGGGPYDGIVDIGGLGYPGGALVIVEDECWYIVVVTGGVPASEHLHRCAARLVS